MQRLSSNHDYRAYFLGLETTVPLLNGAERQYINFDNAASTPPFEKVQKKVNDFLLYYSSVHRGTGFKSQLCTHAFEEARQVVMRFVGADPNMYTCIFGKNTTEAVNKLARRFPFTSDRGIVITTGMEHHSNDLPWRSRTRTVHVALTADGHLDESDFDSKLNLYGKQIALVAVTGASNVSGILNPIHRLAEKAHAIGAQIMVDCAQLVPHRKIDMRPIEDPTHLDYITISAHKLYAPFGTGALIARRDTFETGDPDYSGGGTVEIVTLDDVVWTEPPDRDEAGSPNTVGAIALAAAILQLQEIGMDNVAQHEAELTAYALHEMTKVPGIKIYGENNSNSGSDRLGVIPMDLLGISHSLVASILGHEFGIGVRNGCFCAHPYILHLLGLKPGEAEAVRSQILAGDRSKVPGLLRASFGLYNTFDEIDALVQALTDIAKGNYQGEYIQDKSTGEFHPKGWIPEFKGYFSLGT